MLSVLVHLVVDLIRTILGFLLCRALGLVISTGIVAILIVAVIQWRRSRRTP